VSTGQIASFGAEKECRRNGSISHRGCCILPRFLLESNHKHHEPRRVSLRIEIVSNAAARSSYQHCWINFRRGSRYRRVAGDIRRMGGRCVAGAGLGTLQGVAGSVRCPLSTRTQLLRSDPHPLTDLFHSCPLSRCPIWRRYKSTTRT